MIGMKCQALFSQENKEEYFKMFLSDSSSLAPSGQILQNTNWQFLGFFFFRNLGLTSYANCLLRDDLYEMSYPILWKNNNYTSKCCP